RSEGRLSLAVGAKRPFASAERWCPMSTKKSSLTGISTTSSSPNRWFRKHFPRVARLHGDALLEMLPAKGKPQIKAISEDFMAAVLGEAGFPNEPVVYLEHERAFYRYDKE